VTKGKANLNLLSELVDEGMEAIKAAGGREAALGLNEEVKSTTLPKIENVHSIAF